MSKNFINILVLAFEWFLIIFFIYLNQKYNNSYFHIFSIILIGTRIHALGAMMHEASHFNLLTHPKWNDFIAKVFITAPAFISLDSYRKTHQLHHQYSLTEKDPTHTRKLNKKIYMFPKKSTSLFLKDLLKILFGYGVYLSLKDLFRNQSLNKNSQTPRLLVFKLLSIAGLWFLLVLYGYFKIYLIYWVIPLLTVLPLLNYWRTISEHSSVSSLEATRTVIYPRIWQWLLTPYNLNYHLEHHLFPKKSWYKLNSLSEAEKIKTTQGTTTLGFHNLWKELVT